MITNITTGTDEYRKRKGMNPHFVTWQDHKQRYYAYFPLPFLAKNYADNMVRENE